MSEVIVITSGKGGVGNCVTWMLLWDLRIVLYTIS